MGRIVQVSLSPRVLAAIASVEGVSASMIAANTGVPAVAGTPTRLPQPTPLGNDTVATTAQPTTPRNDTLLFKIAPNNRRDILSTDAVMRRLAELTHAEVLPTEPSENQSGALPEPSEDNWILISRVADIAGIASALWVIYDELIRVRRGRKNKSGRILIVRHPESGLEVEIKGDKNRKKFGERLQIVLTRVEQKTADGTTVTQTEARIETPKPQIKKTKAKRKK